MLAAVLLRQAPFRSRRGRDRCSREARRLVDHAAGGRPTDSRTPRSIATPSSTRRRPRMAALVGIDLDVKQAPIGDRGAGAALAHAGHLRSPSSAARLPHPAVAVNERRHTAVIGTGTDRPRGRPPGGVWNAPAAERLWTDPFVPPYRTRPTAPSARGAFSTQARNAHGGPTSQPSGTPIRAPNAGRIAVGPRSVFFGEHGDHRPRSRAVLDARAHVGDRRAQGDVVKAGQVLGRVGAPGRVTGRIFTGRPGSGARVDPLSSWRSSDVGPGGIGVDSHPISLSEHGGSSVIRATAGR